MSSPSLQRGQRLKLALLTASNQFMVAIKAASPSLQFDISCFGLDENGKLSDDRFFVFYNQPSSPGDAIKLLGARNGDSETFGVNLGKLPPQIRRLVWVLSVDGSGELRQLAPSHLRILVSGQEVAHFQFSGSDLSTEKALMVAELYFKDEWRLNAIAQGFAGGLDAVLVHFGGKVADAPAPIPAAPTATQVKSTIIANAKREFQHLCNQIVFDGNAWKAMKNRALNAGVTSPELLTAIQPAALRFLDNLLEQSAADGIITSEEDLQWTATLSAMDLPQDWLIPYHTRWMAEKKLSAIRQGNLPSVRHDLHFSSDEICHLLVEAKHHKELKSGTQYTPVRLAATSKKVYVLEAGAGGKTISYSQFLKIIPAKETITFEMATKTGAGTYTVDNPALVDAVMTALVKINKRHIVSEKARGRGIPQEVRVAVWQRDKGACVQCGVSGRGACLEYDHILPFSKGGASTIGNIRLLCRRCNSDKGDRI